ncbi:MAG TPA: arsenite methyltransferase [Thermoanaerobaculia bacterium]|nr:arsenite methyltransferase [Thermoanaerobaculia bacterium]
MSVVDPGSANPMKDSEAVRLEVSAAYSRALEHAKRNAGGCCAPAAEETAAEETAAEETAAEETAAEETAAEETAAEETAADTCCGAAPEDAAPAPTSCCGPSAADLGDAAAGAGGVASTLAGYGEERKEAPQVASFGCGNPLAFAEVKPGQTVVDLGSGPGLDLILAARRVGPSGLVIGIDMTDAMIEEARRNAARARLSNIEVRKGLIESLPVEDGTVDWIISNCVINLSPEKPRVFAEIARVLRPGGQFRISDIVVEELPAWIRESAAAYAACVAGAIPEAEYLAGLERAGLTDVAVEHRLVYSAAQIRGLIDHDLKSHGLASDALAGVLDEIEGKVWSAYFRGRRP